MFLLPIGPSRSCWASSERADSCSTLAGIDLVKSLAGNVTTHGLRSSFSTWAGEKSSFPRDLVERVIAHQTGSAVEQAYRRGQELERRRAVLDAWGRFVVDGDNTGQIVVAFEAA